MAAGVAVDANESMGRDTAREVRPDLAFDEAGNGRSLRSRSDEEWHEVRADDFVEEGFLGLVAGVVGDGEASRRDREEIARRPLTRLLLRGVSGESCTTVQGNTQ